MCCLDDKQRTRLVQDLELKTKQLLVSSLPGGESGSIHQLYIVNTINLQS